MQKEAPIRGGKKGTYVLHGLRRLRLQHDYSIRELAWLTDLSPDTIWRLERKQRGAEAKTRRSLAKALDASIAELKRPNTPEEEEELSRLT